MKNKIISALLVLVLTINALACSTFSGESSEFEGMVELLRWPENPNVRGHVSVWSNNNQMAGAQFSGQGIMDAYGGGLTNAPAFNIRTENGWQILEFCPEPEWESEEGWYYAGMYMVE